MGEDKCSKAGHLYASPASLLAMRTAIVAADASLCLLTGIGLFFAPHIAADLIFNGVSDGVHWHLLRCVGGQLIAAAFVLYYIHKSVSEVRSSCYLVRIIGMSLTLLLLNQAASMSPDLIAAKYLSVVKYWCYLVIAVYGSMQTLSGWPIGNSLFEADGVGNFLYQLDSIASIVIGGAFFAFPKWLLYRQVCITILLGQIWSQYAYGAHWGGGHWVGISLYSSWTIISLLYRYSLQKTKDRKQFKKID